MGENRSDDGSGARWAVLRALCLVAAGVLAAGCDSRGATDGGDEGAIGTDEEALSSPPWPSDPPGATCVTLQRGLSGQVEDTDISASNGSWAAGQMPYTWTGAGSSDHWSIHRFDLSSIPQGAHVSLATFAAYVSWNESHAVVRAHRITSPWTEVTASYTNFGGTASWDPSILGTFDPEGVGYKTVDLTAPVQAWVAGEPANHGFLLEEDPGHLHNLLSSETSDAGQRPALRVCYESGPCSGKPDGAACDDGNACTVTDTCQSGACVGGNPVVCDPCQGGGSCDPSTGACVLPAGACTVTFSTGSQNSSFTAGVALSGPSTVTWDFGDGATSGAATVTHVYAAPGAHTITVTVDAGVRLDDVSAPSQGLTAVGFAGACSRVRLLNVQTNQMDGLDVRDLRGLTTLRTANSHLHTLDVSGLSCLRLLDATNNQLSSIDIAAASQLQYLYLGVNQLAALDLSGYPALIEIEAYRNQLASLNLTGTKPGATLLRAYTNHLTNLDVSPLPNVSRLEVFNNQLSSLATGGMAQLRYLDATNNQLTSIDLAAASQLQYMYLGVNQLAALDLSGHPALIEIDAYRNQLASLNLTGTKPAVTLFRAYTNHLTNLDVSPLPNVTRLEVFNNQLSSLATGGMAQLRYLDATNNQLASLDVTAAAGLQRLYVGLNHLTSIDLAGHPVLTDIEVHQNQLGSLDVSGLPALVNVQAWNNQLASFAFLGDTSLHTIGMGGSLHDAAALNAAIAALYAARDDIPHGASADLGNPGLTPSPTALAQIQALEAAPYSWTVFPQY